MFFVCFCCFGGFYVLFFVLFFLILGFWGGFLCVFVCFLSGMAGGCLFVHQNSYTI